MRVHLLCPLLLVSVLCVAGCSPDEDECLVLAECTGSGLASGLDLFRVVADVLEHGDFDLATGAYATSFGGVSVSGTVSAVTGDLSDGFQVGETFSVSYALSGVAAGSGLLGVIWNGPSEMEFKDCGGTIATTLSCTFEITDSELLVDPTGNLWPSGWMTCNTSSGSESGSGMLTFDGTSTVDCSFSCGPIEECSCAFDLIHFEVHVFRCQVPIP